MIENTGRIEPREGLHFYEQDIVRTKYNFSGDIIVSTTIDYVSPGFGLMISKINSRLNKQGDEAVLLKFGFDDFEVHRIKYKEQERLSKVSAFIHPPIKKLSLEFIKAGRELSLVANGERIGGYTLPSDFENYYISLYSNAGNVVKNLDFQSPTPSSWMYTISNTSKGRIQFIPDGFRIEDADSDIEVEQQEVEIPAGTYFFDYERERVSSADDMKGYVYLSDDERFDDEEKHIAKENGEFTLKKDSRVNIKFKGTSGIIKNICIKKSELEDYVSSSAEGIDRDGSYIEILLDEIRSARWKGTIKGVPFHQLGNNSGHEVVSTSIDKYGMIELGLELGKEYLYTFEVDGMRLIVEGENGKKTGALIKALPDEVSLKVFKNLSGSIRDLIVTTAMGEEKNILLQKTQKVFVPSAVKSPIIVTNENGEPLDISSSYRIDKDSEGHDKYIFTNWERELFYPNEPLRLVGSPREEAGSIKVYGIRHDADFELSNIFRSLDGIDDLSSFTDRHEKIIEGDFDFDFETDVVVIDEVVALNYKAFVVDYLKNESYCINYREDISSHEVDISSDAELLFVVYDYLDEDSGTAAVNKYEVTNIKPGLTNKYIVLRKEEA